MWVYYKINKSPPCFLPGSHRGHLKDGVLFSLAVEKVFWTCILKTFCLIIRTGMDRESYSRIWSPNVIFQVQTTTCYNLRHSTFQMVPIKFTLPAVLWKGEAPGGSELKHFITLCFKCLLSVENSRSIFFLLTNHGSLWSLDNHTKSFHFKYFSTALHSHYKHLNLLRKDYTLGY